MSSLNLAAKFRLNLTTIAHLHTGRNLLAFSHGVDSTALFYILEELGVKFDLAILNHGVREESALEVTAARELAAKFNKQIYVRSANLAGANFESRARAARYEFFDEICTKFGYENLILAHQLDDRFEWLLMQLARGAGLSEIVGMREISRRGELNLIRPLLGVSKKQLQSWLDERGLYYFVDRTNLDDSYTRAKFRREFSEPFLAQFAGGVARSFELLETDADVLEPEIVKFREQIYLVRNDANSIRGVDLVCKFMGVLLSRAQRKECAAQLKNGGECVLAGRIAVGLWQNCVSNLGVNLALSKQGIDINFILITPFLSEKIAMDKKFKERCRLAKIPPINRTFLYQSGVNLAELIAKSSKI